MSIKDFYGQRPVLNFVFYLKNILWCLSWTLRSWQHDQANFGWWCHALYLANVAQAPRHSDACQVLKVKIAWQNSTLIPISSATFHTVKRQFTANNRLNNIDGFSFVDVDGRPNTESSSIEGNMLKLKRLNH